LDRCGRSWDHYFLRDLAQPQEVLLTNTEAHRTQEPRVRITQLGKSQGISLIHESKAPILLLWVFARIRWGVVRLWKSLTEHLQVLGRNPRPEWFQLARASP